MSTRWYFARLSACMDRGPVWLTTSLRSCTTSSRSSAASDAACRAASKMGVARGRRRGGCRSTRVNTARRRAAPHSCQARPGWLSSPKERLVLADTSGLAGHASPRHQPARRQLRPLAALPPPPLPPPVHRLRRQGTCHPNRSSRPTFGP